MGGDLTVYDETYGTDWQEIDADEAIERAYALGVSAAIDATHPGELERLVEAVGTASDRALVQLAYDKGRSRAMVVRTSADDERAVWSELVNDAEREPVAVTSQRELPAALRSLPLLERPADDLDRIRLPKFLTRR